MKKIYGMFHPNGKWGLTTEKKVALTYAKQGSEIRWIP